MNAEALPPGPATSCLHTASSSFHVRGVLHSLLWPQRSPALSASGLAPVSHSSLVPIHLKTSIVHTQPHDRFDFTNLAPQDFWIPPGALSSSSNSPSGPLGWYSSLRTGHIPSFPLQASALISSYQCSLNICRLDELIIV